MKADATTQWRLLDLAELDTRLAQLAHRRRTSPEQSALDATTRERAGVHDEVVRARTALADVELQVSRAADAVAQLRDRMARNQSRLDSGQGSPRDLQALTHELESMRRRQGVLEEEQLEVMERAETLQGELDAVAAREAEVDERLADQRRALDAVLSQVDLEQAEAARRRDEVRPGVGSALLALYDKVSEQVGGAGAAALVARRCTGCNIELGPVDLSTIRAAAADDVVRCEECRRILVRTAESGL